MSDGYAHIKKSGVSMITSVSSQQVSVVERAVLNVGGNNKSIEIPECFMGWRHDLLDIDPGGKPDVLCDARELWKLPPRQYDAIYCSHNLEHYYPHEVPIVLKGFRMLLKKKGFAYIRVPDLLEVMKAVVERGMELNDVLYESPAGSILVRDVIYGYHRQIERSGSDFFAHKTGYTEKLLTNILMDNGFPYVYSDVAGYEIMALAFLAEPEAWQADVLKLR